MIARFSSNNRAKPKRDINHMALLTAGNISKAFGGLQATNNVSLEVETGERVSIIGPNGAGKTTLFNQISGYIRPDSGHIIFDGHDITALSAHDIVRRGIGRAFQRSNIFPRLTAFANIQVAVISQYKLTFNLWRPASQLTIVNERTTHILETIGLNDKQANRMAGQLALGDQKRLEIGLALALEPKLLLLDEPTAGMSAQETEGTVQLIKNITEQFDMSLLFTEHDMDVVFGISERIYVLNQGNVIAQGAPQDIADNPRVQQVYLGTTIEEE
ncbi:MAG: ABC transporter ATP-binding protein [Anaerolineae bacterium]|nr:ABC transporter ATP-binding protein [Anaerolineae bacterium]MDQ7034692.1 ABC transporter ATP-binding protein [Anaerolineae bacterium]